MHRTVSVDCDEPTEIFPEDVFLFTAYEHKLKAHSGVADLSHKPRGGIPVERSRTSDA